MTTSCLTIEERSRKNGSAILQRLVSVGQSEVARELNLSESTVSRMKGGEIDQMAKMLAVLGLKTVPIEMKCFNPKDIDALLTLAKSKLSEIEHTDQLIWEE